MKKRLLALILSALLLTNAVACGYTTNQNDCSLANMSEIESVNTLTAEEAETIVFENHYRFYRIVETFEWCCDIYNLDGNIVFRERTQRPLTVSEIASNLIEIRVGYGTGIVGCRYFDVENSQMSKEFFYVVATSDTRVAYLSGDIDNRRLIVQDIYSSTDDHQSFDLDFSSDHMPIIEAKFSNDGEAIQLTYMKGDSYTTSQITLNLS